MFLLGSSASSARRARPASCDGSGSSLAMVMVEAVESYITVVERVDE